MLDRRTARGTAQVVCAALAAAVLVAGCSTTTEKRSPSTKPGSTPASKPSNESSTETPSGPLGAEACSDINGAKAYLILATTTDEAREQVDILEKYNPPGKVKAALEHFVETKGAQFDDPDFNQNNATVDNWIAEVCPS